MTSARSQNLFTNGKPSYPQPASSQETLSSRPTSQESNHLSMYNGVAAISLDSYIHPSHSIPRSDIADHSPQHQTDPFRFDDFLTPEYSSENAPTDLSAHTTPSADELQWDQGFNDQPLHQSLDHPWSNFNTSGHTTQLFPNQAGNEVQEFASQPSQYNSKPLNGSQLLSPQLTTTPSPPAQVRTDIPHPDRQGGTGLFTPDNTKMGKRKINPDSLLHLQISSGLQRSGRSDHASLDPSPTEPDRAVSPVVLVSSYSRGDSPAGSRVPLSRTASKRSQGSRSSELLVPHTPHVLEEETPEFLEHSRNILAPTRGAEDLGQDSNLDRGGLEPGQRGDDLVPSLQDIEEQRKLQEKNAEVASWLSKSENGSQDDEQGSPVIRRRRDQADRRIRSRSTGMAADPKGVPKFTDAYIPGPGVLLAEESEADETDEEESVSDMSESGVTSPPAHVDPEAHLATSDYFPAIEEIAPEDTAPLPHQFYRRSPWEDQVRAAGPINSRDQPPSSNAAMYRYDQQAAKFETASRAATWGTRRRNSDTDVSSVAEGNKTRHLSLSKGRERGVSFIGKFRRTPSTSKQKAIEPAGQKTPPDAEYRYGESFGGAPSLQRLPSVGKSRSPARAAGNAIMAMKGHLTAVGRSTSATPETAAPSSPFNLLLKRNRSKSELPKSKGTPGLAELMTQHGGPPMPTLASPMQERRPSSEKKPQRASDDDEDDDDDDDDDDIMAGKGEPMDLKVRIDNIIPDLEGFKDHARTLNPRLAPFLLDRIAQEQVRRYKKLLDNKVKHTRDVKLHNKCSSGKHCFELNGEATLLPPRTNAKDPDATYAQFQITGHGDTDEEDTFAEGILSPALFPSGIPEPPVKRLPAQFECPLCFKVKKFQKPSDWTKHVHEDVQPFSCTFPNCTDPKSFKRKADWVRHENERHRHLEWWQCSIAECNHKCFRKDNFVQHLVREHKLPEPKVKRGGSGSSKAKGANGSNWPESQPDEVWTLLDSCHYETTTKPKDEICKFCGNMCSTWKKVSAHLGKHMEQIALPVLELVKQREVSPETIISPIEQSYQPPSTRMPVNTNIMYGDNPSCLSPYPVSSTSLYQGSSAGHSPATIHSYAQPSQMSFVPGYQGNVGQQQPHMQTPVSDSGEFGAMDASSSNMGYPGYRSMVPPNAFVSVNGSAYQAQTYPTVRRSPLQSTQQAQMPRSQPLQHEMQAMQLNATPQAMFHPQQPQEVMYSSPVSAHYMAQYGQHNGMAQVTSQMGYEGIPASAMNDMDPDGMYHDYEMAGQQQQHAGHGYQQQRF